MKDPKVLWESIRNASGWSWALGTIKQDLGCLELLGPNWGESVLHWAMLGSLEACAELLSLDDSLLSRTDIDGRAPLDWAMEKIYFMKDEAKQGSIDSRSLSMLSQARGCLLFGLNWVAAQSYDRPWSGAPTRFLQLALSAGELEVAKQASGIGAVFGLDLWLCGLAGLWCDQAAVDAYALELKERFGLREDSVVFDLPLGLHVAKLWCDESIDDEAVLRLHNAGMRVDQETPMASIEVFYASSSMRDTVRLSQLMTKLGL